MSSNTEGAAAALSGDQNSAREHCDRFFSICCPVCHKLYSNLQHSHLSVCISEVGVISCAFDVI